MQILRCAEAERQDKIIAPEIGWVWCNFYYLLSCFQINEVGKERQYVPCLQFPLSVSEIGSRPWSVIQWNVYRTSRSQAWHSNSLWILPSWSIFCAESNAELIPAMPNSCRTGSFNWLSETIRPTRILFACDTAKESHPSSRTDGCSLRVADRFSCATDWFSRDTDWFSCATDWFSRDTDYSSPDIAYLVICLNSLLSYRFE
jgi:hypothetical protein